jgi:hypothetical protein
LPASKSFENIVAPSLSKETLSSADGMGFFSGKPKGEGKKNWQPLHHRSCSELNLNAGSQPLSISSDHIYDSIDNLDICSDEKPPIKKDKRIKERLREFFTKIID